MSGDAAVDALVAWARDQGATLDPRLTFCGRTLTVRPDAGALPPGTRFLSVPRCALITRHTLPADPDYGAAWASIRDALAGGDDADGPLDGRDAVCLALLVEKARGSASRFAPYVAALPTEYDDPTWWDADVVSLLDGSRLGAAAAVAVAAVARLARIARRLAAAGPPNGPLTTDGWCVSEQGARWARSTVWSRAFNLPSSQPTHAAAAAALVPVADMMDHNPAIAGMAWSVGAGDEGDEAAPSAVTYTTLTPTAAGAPLFSNYSHRKSDEELISGYGFALASNPANFFHFALASGGRGAAARRAARRARGALGPAAAEAFCRADDPLPRSALASVALALVEGGAAAELECVDAAAASEAAHGAPPSPPAVPTVTSPVRPPPGPPAQPPGCDWGLPVPPATALAALGALRRALAGRAAALAGGAAAADEAAAAAAGVHRHTAMALNYRANQKRLAAGAQAALARVAAAVVGALSDGAVAAGLVPTHVAADTTTALVHEVGVPATPLAGARCAGNEPWRGWAWGLRVGAAGAAAGDVLAAIPAADVWTVPCDDPDAVEDAVLAAAAAGGVFGGGEAAPARPLIHHLATVVAPPPAARLLLASSGVDPGVAAALQDTPAGDEAAAAAGDAVAAADGDAAAARARGWAAAAVERAALDGPTDDSVAFARLASAVPPCLRGVAVDVAWRADGSAALVAACDLAPGTWLTPALAILGGDAGALLAEHGPEAVAALEDAPAVLPRGLGGGTVLRHSVAVDPSAAASSATAAALLQAACLDGPHHLTPAPATAARAGVAAAVAGARKGDLKAGDAKGAVAARKAAAAAAAAADAAGGAGRDAAAAATVDADARTAAAAAAVAASPSGRRGVAELREALVASADVWRQGVDDDDAATTTTNPILTGCRAYRRGVASVAAAAARALAVRRRSEE